MNTRNLAQRLLFALWAAPLGWLLANCNISLLTPQLSNVLFGTPEVAIYAGQVLAILLVFLGCSEYLRMLATLFRRNGFWLVYLWLGAQCLKFLLPDHVVRAIDAFDRYDIYILLLIIAAEAAIWGKFSSRWKRASLLFSGMVFLSYACHSMVSLYREPFQTIFPPAESMLYAYMGLVTVLASIFLCDTMAYFAGSLWGKHHFTRISPHKTLEGAVAGLLTAIAVSSTGWALFASPTYSIWLGVVMGVIIGVAGQTGDLLVSLMKRYFHVKDASNLIPGHGGVLDRFDSLFFTAPILNLFFIVVDKLS